MTSIRPAHIELFPSGEIGIRWEDGREDYFDPRTLRLLCPCAGCVDELTGRRTLDPGTVPATIRALGWNPVGNYAVNFRWADAHASGIYSFQYLREIAEKS